jgi:Caspase domain
MAKNALLVGIDAYRNLRELGGCVADVLALRPLLERHADGELNYDCRVLLGRKGRTSPRVTRPALRDALRELFSNPGEVVFYFSGHGAVTETGGFLATHEAERDDWGVKMQEVMEWAKDSRSSHILLMLDCCHGGDMGDAPMLNPALALNPLALLRQNMTIIAASRNDQGAVEVNGHGVFTATVLEALDGGAADHMGWVTAPSVYAYVERRFGGWQQRPVYKSHATELAVLRECAPLIERMKLRELLRFFPERDYKYRLDPEYDPEDEFGQIKGRKNRRKIEIGRRFKEYRDAGLLRATVPGEDFYWVARRGHTVELTARGREYWWLVKENRI